MHIIAAKAVAFKEALDEEFKEYMKQVVKNCKALAESLKDYGFKIVSGGTDTHLILVDLTNKDITGKEAQMLLDSIGVTLNKNTVPDEKRSPFVTSGVRIGTAAVTTRGYKEEDMKEIASIINEAIEKREEGSKELIERVRNLSLKHRMYI